MNRYRTALLPLIGLSVTMLLALGCDGQGGAGPTVFYPQAPDPPRLQFLMSFSDPAQWARPRRSSFSDFIVGTEKGKQGMIRGPYGLAARDGKLYICDLGAHRVHVIDMINKTYKLLGKPGQIRNPVNITLGPDGTKYVCDTQLGRVLVYNAADKLVKTLGDPRTCIPSDLAIMGRELLVADIAGAELEVWDRDGKFLRIIAGKGKEPGQLSMPANIEIGPGDRIFVSDTMASIINVYSRTGKYIGSVGMPGDRPGYFARPKGIAIDDAGRIYVADAQWEIVQLFAPTGKLLMFFGGASGAVTGMGMPAGLVIDRSMMPVFQKYVDEDFEAEYLLFVANQFGEHKIGVYAFGQSKTADYSQPTTRPASSAATQPAK